MNYIDLNQPIQAWGLLVALTLLFYVVLSIVRRLVESKLEKISQATTTQWDDFALEVLRGTKRLFLLVLSLFLSAQVHHPLKGASLVHKVLILALVIQVAFWGSILIRHWIDRYIKANSDDGAKATTMRAIGFLARLGLYAILLLWGLDNFGVNITTLVAGLGVGGIAVALAVQNILSDLFASLTIVLDKPFVIGDFITVGDLQGTVEYVGLKTTRIRSLSGEQLVFPNADLLQSRIRNFKRMKERRAVFSFGVTYETPRTKLAQIPTEVKRIVEAMAPTTRFDRAHFKGFGASSLDFEVVYWVLDPDFNVYMDIQQKINLALVDYFQKEAIEFAYPTQTLHIPSMRNMQ